MVLGTTWLRRQSNPLIEIVVSFLIVWLCVLATLFHPVQANQYYDRIRNPLEKRLYGFYEPDDFTYNAGSRQWLVGCLPAYPGTRVYELDGAGAVPPGIYCTFS